MIFRSPIVPVRSPRVRSDVAPSARPAGQERIKAAAACPQTERRAPRNPLQSVWSRVQRS